jgi:L-ascorbate metabolism protein UlaG (beta-lactamase superfamily)
LFLSQAAKQDGKFRNPVETRIGGASMIFKLLPLYLKNKEEKFPRTPLGPFLTDARVYTTPPLTGLRVTWFGHSSMLLEMDGARILIDPVWDQRVSPSRRLGPRRFYPPTLPLEQLPVIDAVVISHDHYDHLGKATVRQLSQLSALAETQWVTPLGVGKLLRDFGVAAARVKELDWTQTATIARGACTVTSVPARHFSGRSLFNRFETLWASFVIKGKDHAVYYGADSGLWEGFAEIGAAYGPFDLTMLEIGASHEFWKDIHMGPDGAAHAYAALGGPARAGLLMPIHWGLFDLALHGWRQPIKRLLEIAKGQELPLFVPEPGVPTEAAALQSDWWQPQRSARDKAEDRPVPRRQSVT